jgi:hypothetical protein
MLDRRKHRGERQLGERTDARLSEQRRNRYGDSDRIGRRARQLTQMAGRDPARIPEVVLRRRLPRRGDL